MDFTPPSSPVSSSTPSHQSSEAAPSRNSSRVSVDTRVIIVLLLLIIVGMLLAWRPWHVTSGHSASDRTIRVNGQATIKAEPDQYVFNPNYQFNNADRAAALDALSKKNSELVAGLKKTGVTDAQIKTNANDYQSGGIYYSVPSTEPGTGIKAPTPPSANYTLQLTVTVQDKAIAQKVQDYLASTTPSGSVTPGASFSTAKRQQLEDQARDQATRSARKKAEQSATNLGFKLGDVKTVSDDNGFGAYPLSLDAKTMEAVPPSAGVSSPSNISVHPGENELTYSVAVEYYVR